MPFCSVVPQTYSSARRVTQQSVGPSVQSGDGRPGSPAVPGAAELASDNGGEHLVLTADRELAREPAHLTALVPAAPAVGAHADLAVAVDAVERVLARPDQARAERRVARAPGSTGVGGYERALLGRHRPLLGVTRVDDHVDRGGRRRAGVERGTAVAGD